MIDKVVMPSAIDRLVAGGSDARLARLPGNDSTVPGKAIRSPDETKAVAKAKADFTAMVLQNFLDAAVPENLTGSGSPSGANGMWRSLLVEQLARSVAQSGQFNVFGDVADNRLIAPADNSLSGAQDLTTNPSKLLDDGKYRNDQRNQS